MSKISFEPEGHALLVLAHRAHLLNRRIRTTDLTPLVDWLQAHHSLAGLTEHDALLLAEVLAWAIARTRAPLHALRAVAADAAGGNIRLDNGQRVAAVLREVGAVSPLLKVPSRPISGQGEVGVIYE